MKYPKRAGSFILTCLCCLCGAGPWLASAEPIRINGSGSALDMMKPLVAAYRKANPGVTIDIDKPLGSSGAIKALLAGALDFAVTSKPLAPEDAARGAQLRAYGRTPLVIVTGSPVGRTNLTSSELAEIYAGRLKAWPSGEAIRVVLRPEGDIDTRILENLSPAMLKAMAEAQKRPGMLIAVTDPESNETVAKTPGSIGASGLTGMIGEHAPLNTLTLDGVQPTLHALATGAYPLAKGINFVTTARTSAEGRKLLDFIFSARGRALAEKAGVLVLPGASSGQ
jgi:phosphate transport system substrate-binding protein